MNKLANRENQTSRHNENIKIVAGSKTKKQKLTVDEKAVARFNALLEEIDALNLPPCNAVELVREQRSGDV